MEMPAMLHEQARRVADLLRRVPDPQAAVPGLQWTVADTAVHLVSELHDYAQVASGEMVLTTVDGGSTAARRGAENNARQLAAWQGRDLGEIADALAPAVDEFLTAAAARRPD